MSGSISKVDVCVKASMINYITKQLRICSMTLSFEAHIDIPISAFGFLDVICSKFVDLLMSSFLLWFVP